MSVRKIADLAGVSTATVSYALNGQKGISPETRSMVLKAARSIGYKPSVRKTRQIPTEKTTCFTFVSFTPFPVLGEHYFGQLVKGCITKAQEKEIMLSIADINPENTQGLSIPKMIRSEVVKGLIVTGWPSAELMGLLTKEGKPIVLLDTRDVFQGFDHVRPDNTGGTIKSVEYLHGLGHRRIGVIAGDMQFFCEVERVMAYMMAMTKLGLPWEDRWIIRQPLMAESTGYQGMKELLQRKIDVTAVMCHGDLMARGAIRAAKECGLAVPGDISIMGFDNQPFSAEVDPPITTVDTCLQQLGQAAVSRLLELMDDPESGVQRMTMEAKLLERGSVARMA